MYNICTMLFQRLRHCTSVVQMFCVYWVVRFCNLRFELILFVLLNDFCRRTDTFSPDIGLHVVSAKGSCQVQKKIRETTNPPPYAIFVLKTCT